MKLRKVSIVIEETGVSGGSFDIYVDGDKERIGVVSEDQLTAAEYWGVKLFSVCIQHLKLAGVVKSETGKEMH